MTVSRLCDRHAMSYLAGAQSRTVELLPLRGCAKQAAVRAAKGAMT
jgi:hypothetical protein